jgi:hypothetical protein
MKVSKGRRTSLCMVLLYEAYFYGLNPIPSIVLTTKDTKSTKEIIGQST